MTTKAFSKGEALRFGWNTMKRHFWFFIVVLLISFLISIIPESISELTKKDARMISFLFSLISIFLNFVIEMGFIKITLKFADQTKPEVIDLFSCIPLFFKFLLGTLLYALIVIAGLILFIVPGIIWAVKFQFYAYFIVDTGAGPIEALKRSSNTTRGVKWDLFLFGILLLIINLLGAFAVLIGLLATIPTTMVAVAYVYRKLFIQKEVAQSPLTV